VDYLHNLVLGGSIHWHLRFLQYRTRLPLSISGTCSATDDQKPANGCPRSFVTKEFNTMKKNPVKAALAAGQPSVGTWLSFGDVFTARLMARTGFPWLTVDMEHSPIDWQMASMMFATIADSGCVPLARVPRGDHDLIKRVLDGGAMGIVVPMVNTVEEAKLAIAAAKYPPAGNRSIGGSIPALNFNASAGDYYKYANNEVLVILQTESPEGVDNAEEIYSLPGVDAIFVGPNDLFWQMKPEDGSDPTPEEFEAMLQRILAAGKKTGTPVGLHAQSVEEVQMRIAEGWQFLALQSELKMMVTKAQEHVAALGLSAANDLARY
jgi:4-hydroxy-2-oxoheptanedioate aldolase